jgi:hypothetical protein
VDYPNKAIWILQSKDSINFDAGSDKTTARHRVSSPTPGTWAFIFLVCKNVFFIVCGTITSHGSFSLFDEVEEITSPSYSYYKNMWSSSTCS